MKKIIIYGNSGSGKSTLAGQLKVKYNIPVLDMDTITWVTDQPGVRLALDVSVHQIMEFINEHPEWIMEGCYGDLIERALPYSTELIFLNPGIEQCLLNNLKRPFESHKYASLEEQNKHFEFLQKWVQEYDQRDYEFSYLRHRKIYDLFQGSKREITSTDSDD